jgi:hypothetical protein
MTEPVWVCNSTEEGISQHREEAVITTFELHSVTKGLGFASHALVAISMVVVSILLRSPLFSLFVVESGCEIAYGP